MKGPPLSSGGEDTTWPYQVAPRGRRTSSTRNLKPQISNLPPVPVPLLVPLLLPFPLLFPSVSAPCCGSYSAGRSGSSPGAFGLRFACFGSGGASLSVPPFVGVALSTCAGAFCGSRMAACGGRDSVSCMRLVWSLWCRARLGRPARHGGLVSLRLPGFETCALVWWYPFGRPSSLGVWCVLCGGLACTDSARGGGVVSVPSVQHVLLGWVFALLPVLVPCPIPSVVAPSLFLARRWCSLCCCGDSPLLWCVIPGASFPVGLLPSPCAFPCPFAAGPPFALSFPGALVVG